MITSQEGQNTPLHREIQSGRAIFNSLRISYAMRHLLITPKHSKTLHSSSKLEWSALKSTLFESLARRPSHLPPMIPSEEGQYTPLRRNIELVRSPQNSLE